MASYFYAPAPLNDTFLIPGTNTPGNGVQVFLYQAGSSTKSTVYKDNAGNASWSNPIVLDSGGNLPSAGAMWFLSGLTYKAVYAPSNDTDPPASPYRTIDNLAGINDVSATQSEWSTGPTPTFVSGTQFTMSGDQTVNFKVSRRLKFTVTAGTVYGTISSVSFAANTTTVNVAFASGVLDSGLSAVSYSVVSVDTPSIDADYSDKFATTIPSASNGTTNIWGVAGNSVHINGTNAINNFSTAPYVGAIRELVFDSAVPINYSSTQAAIPGNANITTAVGDVARVYADNGSTKIIGFQRASGVPLVAPLGSQGASLVFLSSTAAVSSSSLQISGLTGFNSYKLFFNNVVPSTTSDVWCRFSTNSAATFDATSAYQYVSGSVVSGVGTLNAQTNSGDTKLILSFFVSSTAGMGFSGEITLNNLTGLSAFSGILGARTSSNAYGTYTDSGIYTAGNPVNALTVFPNASSATNFFTTGSIYAYGVKAP